MFKEKDMFLHVFTVEEATRLEAVAIGVEAWLLGWRPSLVGWRPSLVGWSQYILLSSSKRLLGFSRVQVHDSHEGGSEDLFRRSKLSFAAGAKAGRSFHVGLSTVATWCLQSLTDVNS